MLSAAQLAHRSASAGSATAISAAEANSAPPRRPAAAPNTARNSSAYATAGRGRRVPSSAQTGLSSRPAAHPSTAPRGPAAPAAVRANHAQAASSVHPTRMERRMAKRASSGKRLGRIGAGGMMRNRDRGVALGSNSSGIRGGSDTGAHIPHLRVAPRVGQTEQAGRSHWNAGSRSLAAQTRGVQSGAVEHAAHSFGAMNSCAHCGAPFNPMVDGQTVCDRCQGLAHPEPSSPLQQAEVAGFKLLHELGAGRFSHSWLGEDARSHAVVVKLLRRYAPDPEAVHTFLAEAERLATAAELDHPHLARPLSAGVHLVQAFFLVYQGGGELTLADELRRRGRVVPARALELCAQICEGLAALHRAGVLHLDLKPANVGLTRLLDGTEQAVVLDGVTSHLLAHVRLRDGEPLPLSTAAYTAPEQAAGGEADPRSDLYSVGVLLFHLVSGRLPLAGATSEDLLRAHREHRTLRLRDVGRRVHPELEDLIARLMARDAKQRPGNGDEAALMMRALGALADAVPVEDATEPEDDPRPIPLPRLREASAPPPQMLPRPDPALERAMMGEVPAATAGGPPRVSRWMASVRRRPSAAAAGALILVAAVGLLAARARRSTTPAPAPVA